MSTFVPLTKQEIHDAKINIETLKQFYASMKYTIDLVLMPIQTRLIDFIGSACPVDHVYHKLYRRVHDACATIDNFAISIDGNESAGCSDMNANLMRILAARGINIIEETQKGCSQCAKIILHIIPIEMRIIHIRGKTTESVKLCAEIMNLIREFTKMCILSQLPDKINVQMPTMLYYEAVERTIAICEMCSAHNITDVDGNLCRLEKEKISGLELCRLHKVRVPKK